MSVFHDEIEIEDMEYDESSQTYTYPCPCGDQFIVSEQELIDGEDIARCPSCSLYIRVIYDREGLVGKLQGQVDSQVPISTM
jgi:diphthamide biosynthesis protein 3